MRGRLCGREVYLEEDLADDRGLDHQERPLRHPTICVWCKRLHEGVSPLCEDCSQWSLNRRRRHGG